MERASLLVGIAMLIASLLLCGKRATVVAASAPTPVRLTTAVRDSLVIVTGTVPDEATRSRLVADAGAHFTGRRILDSLVVSAASQAAWPARTIVLTGEVATDSIKTAIGAAVARDAGTGVTIDNQLRAPSAAVAAQRTINEVLRLKVVEFRSASAVLTPAGRATLDEVTTALATTATATVEVVGHTDNVGLEATNAALSLARANATIEYLAGKGLDRGRFTARGAGSSAPVADNGTAEGRQRNRRIEFIVQGGAQ